MFLPMLSYNISISLTEILAVSGGGIVAGILLFILLKLHAKVVYISLAMGLVLFIAFNIGFFIRNGFSLPNIISSLFLTSLVSVCLFFTLRAVNKAVEKKPK
jgi:hypothetical protein